jgi:hypothetical protein
MHAPPVSTKHSDSELHRSQPLPVWHAPLTHSPLPSQASPTVQTLPSSHGAPFASKLQVAEQQSPPSLLPSSQSSPRCKTPSPQELSSRLRAGMRQRTASGPLEQVPDWHKPLSVQPFPSSLHVVPSTEFGCWHPVDVLQLSTVHSFPSSQFSGDPAVHVPPTHESPTVHTLPSEQLVPLGAGDPALHIPPTHESPAVHTLPSEQLVPLGAGGCWHPDVGLQESVVHAFPSSQSTGLPATQLPPEHSSPDVHTLPSEQASPVSCTTHRDEHPSQSSVFPSSHASPASTTSLPQPTQGPRFAVSVMYGGEIVVPPLMLGEVSHAPRSRGSRGGKRLGGSAQPGQSGREEAGRVR